MAQYSPYFYAECLSNLRDGDLDLGVPLVDGAIQIGAVQAAQPGRITVSKAGEQVCITSLSAIEKPANTIGSFAVHKQG